MNTNYTFPDLTGSSKQVKWAEFIRESTIKMIKSDVEVARNGFASGFDLQDAEVVYDEVVDTFMNIDSASTIIDNSSSFSRFKLDEMLHLEHVNKTISIARSRRIKGEHLFSEIQGRRTSHEKVCCCN